MFWKLFKVRKFIFFLHWNKTKRLWNISTQTALSWSCCFLPKRVRFQFFFPQKGLYCLKETRSKSIDTTSGVQWRCFCWNRTNQLRLLTHPANGEHGKALVTRSKSTREPEAMPASHSTSQTPFLSLFLTITLLLIFTPLHRAHVFTHIIRGGLGSCYKETPRSREFKWQSVADRTVYISLLSLCSARIDTWMKDSWLKMMLSSQR